MKYFTLFLLSLFFINLSQLHAGVLIDTTLVHNDSTRHYKLYLPDDYTGDESWPMVIVLHGYTLNADIIMGISGMNTIADTGHFVVVYPQGLTVNLELPVPGFPPSAPGWNLGAVQTSNNDDVGFISQLIDEINGYQNIDLNRVYVCGLSNGGFMVNKLACELSDKIASFASVSGLLLENVICEPDRPIPILYINGTADPIVSFNGIPGIAHSVSASIDFWLAHNECNTSPTIIMLPDIDTSDSCTVTMKSYNDCVDNFRVVLYQIENGGHDWAGSLLPSPPFLGFTNQDINGSSEIWNFFNGTSLLTSVTEKSIPLDINIYPNPFSESVFIELDLPEKKEVQLQLFNILGQPVGGEINQELPAGFRHITWNIDNSSLQQGMYFVHLTIDGEQLVRSVVFQSN